MRSSQGFLLNIAPRLCAKYQTWRGVAAVRVGAGWLEGECMGEQLPITWSPLVTGRYLHGPGLSRMADNNSGHEALAPDILGWAGQC